MAATLATFGLIAAGGAAIAGVAKAAKCAYDLYQKIKPQGEIQDDKTLATYEDLFTMFKDKIAFKHLVGIELKKWPNYIKELCELHEIPKKYAKEIILDTKYSDIGSTKKKKFEYKKGNGEYVICNFATGKRADGKIDFVMWYFSCNFETQTKAMTFESKERMCKYFHHRAAVLFNQDMPELAHLADHGQQKQTKAIDYCKDEHVDGGRWNKQKRSAYAYNDDDDDDDDSKSVDPVAVNAVIKCSKYNKLNGHRKPTPCLILSKPSKYQSKFHVRIAAPFQAEECWIHPEQFMIVYKDEAYVSKVEVKWMQYYESGLGYDSIQQRGKNYDDDDDEEDDEVAANALIKLSTYNKLGRHKKTMPCLIIAEPTKNVNKFHIRLPAPFGKETYWVSPDKYMIERLDKEIIRKAETFHVNHFQMPLGYKSVDQREEEEEDW